VKRHAVKGNPVRELISTNAFSKKFENFRAAVALHYAYYNFVKFNSAVRCTPAMAAGVENSAWTFAIWWQGLTRDERR
jgi:hypothetical protein